MKHLIVVVLTVGTFSCQASEPKSPDTTASPIIGRWSMERVYDGAEDVTERHDPSDTRWIEFAAEGTFVSDGEPHGRNTGRWTLGEETQELYLDSDAGEGDDSYWVVRVEGDTMRWQGARSAFTERFAIIHARQ